MLCLQIISSFIFSRFSSANGPKRRMDFLAWSFEGSNSKIFFISTSKPENNINYKTPSYQHVVLTTLHNPGYPRKLVKHYHIKQKYNGLTIILNPNIPAIASSKCSSFSWASPLLIKAFIYVGFSSNAFVHSLIVSSYFP